MFRTGSSIVPAPDAPTTDRILNLMVSLKSNANFTGAQKLWTYTTDFGSLSSGTQDTGAAITVAAPSGPSLTVTSLHTGTFSQGQSGAVYTLSVGNLIGTAPTSGTVTVTEIVPPGMTLVSMSGTGWTCPAGTNACTRSDALAAGALYPDITVTVNIASAASVVSNGAVVSGGGSSSFTASDPTTILGSPASIVSVTPASQWGGFGWYTITANDNNGYTDLSSVALLISGASPTTDHACYVQYNRAANTLALADDNGVLGTARQVGALWPEENSQCSIRRDWDSASPSGANGLAANILVYFKPSFGGSKTVYARAATAAVSGDWQTKATAAIVQGAAVQPASQSGSTFTVTYKETYSGDATNLTQLYFWAAPNPLATVNSCYLYFDAPSGRFKLANDAFTAYLDVTPGTGSQSNSQCTLSGAGSSRVVSGDTATLTVNLTFNSTYAGAHNLYALGGGAVFSSGWYNIGSYTVVAAETISTPNITGPSSGIAGTSVGNYGTSGSTSSLGHAVQYQFDWGDGSLSSWVTAAMPHTWAGAGTYTVKIHARCATDTAIVSAWSSPLTVTITAPPTEAITTPSVTGPTAGAPNSSYTYTASGASSNFGHSVQYQFNWGDGTNSGWLAVGTTTASHPWSAAGTYSVTVQARCATDTGVTSSASSVLSLVIETITTPSVSGPTAGTQGTNYSYTATGATSSLGHSVQYQFNWGDGTNS